MQLENDEEETPQIQTPGKRSLVELEKTFLTQLEEEETLADYEERLARGLGLVSEEEAPSAQDLSLCLLQQARFYREIRRLGLTTSQVRMLLMSTTTKMRETPTAFARRYEAGLAVYLRTGGCRDESLLTKGRMRRVADPRRHGKQRC